MVPLSRAPKATSQHIVRSRRNHGSEQHVTLELTLAGATSNAEFVPRCDAARCSCRWPHLQELNLTRRKRHLFCAAKCRIPSAEPLASPSPSGGGKWPFKGLSPLLLCSLLPLQTLAGHPHMHASKPESIPVDADQRPIEVALDSSRLDFPISIGGNMRRRSRHKKSFQSRNTRCTKVWQNQRRVLFSP